MKQNKNRKVKLDDQIDDDYLSNMYKAQKEIPSSKLKKQAVEYEEYIPVTKPKNIYKNLDPLTEKIEIQIDKKYVGTS